jgi:hypothetical protein
MLDMFVTDVPQNTEQFYADMRTAGFEEELDGFAVGNELAIQALNWAGNDATVVGTLAALNATDGNKAMFVDGSKDYEGSLYYDMNTESMAMRDLGYRVSRGGHTLGGLISYVKGNPERFEDIDGGFSGAVEWLQKQVLANGWDWATGRGFLISNSTDEWSSMDLNFDRRFRIADSGSDRKGFILLGEEGEGFGSDELRVFGRNNDTEEEAIAALYDLVGIDENLDFVE